MFKVITSLVLLILLGGEVKAQQPPKAYVTTSGVIVGPPVAFVKTKPTTCGCNDCQCPDGACPVACFAKKAVTIPAVAPVVTYQWQLKQDNRGRQFYQLVQTQDGCPNGQCPLKK